MVASIFAALAAVKRNPQLWFAAASNAPGVPRVESRGPGHLPGQRVLGASRAKREGFVGGAGKAPGSCRGGGGSRCPLTIEDHRLYLPQQLLKQRRRGVYCCGTAVIVEEPGDWFPKQIQHRPSIEGFGTAAWLRRFPTRLEPGPQQSRMFFTEGVHVHSTEGSNPGRGQSCAGPAIGRARLLRPNRIRAAVLQ
jgi:hypothetical protein